METTSTCIQILNIFLEHYGSIFLQESSCGPLHHESSLQKQSKLHMKDLHGVWRNHSNLFDHSKWFENGLENGLKNCLKNGLTL